jgi:carbohydrate kinase (thermoresistant glucokinase family)
MLVLVMGVSGCGKTTLGRLLAERLGANFLDGDDFHPEANVRKMAGGTALDDDDRRPWLARLNAELRAGAARGDSAVLACSALKATYRAWLGEGLPRLDTVFLYADPAVIRDRLAARSHRYMPASLLQSQLDTLEAPADAIGVDVAQAPDACVSQVLAALEARR